jgi:hypothetical protein
MNAAAGGLAAVLRLNMMAWLESQLPLLSSSLFLNVFAD